MDIRRGRPSLCFACCFNRKGLKKIRDIPSFYDDRQSVRKCSVLLAVGGGFSPSPFFR